MTPANGTAESLLEAYALDQLSPAERRAVAQALAERPELRERLAQIEANLESLALASAVTPPPALRGQTLARLEAAGAFAPASKQRVLSPPMWLAAASLALLVGMAAGLYGLYSRVATLSDQVVELQSQNGNIAQVLHRTSVHTTNLRTELKLTSEGYRRVELASVTADGTGGSALVYWSAERGETYFVGQLPPVPEGKQYQLWALHNGQPVDAGLLGIVPNGILEPMKKIPQAEAFAVTLEPVGGSANPTTQAMMVLGKVN